MTTLPSLRRKIRRSFFVLVGFYTIFGVLLLIAVSIAIKNTPRLLHRNYDSIAAMMELESSWDILRAPSEYPKEDLPKQLEKAEKAIQFESTNLTEVGEAEIFSDLKTSWSNFKKLPNPEKWVGYPEAKLNIQKIIHLNEQGMFKLAHQNAKLSRAVGLGALIFFLTSILLAVFVGDGLADRISRPLKDIAEALQSNRSFQKRLKLPDANTLELLVLNQQLTSLWSRLQGMEQVNLEEILRQKRKLEVLFASVEDAVLVLDPGGKISQCSPLLMDLLGLPEKQIVGQNWRDLSTSNQNYLRLREVVSESMDSGTEIQLVLHGNAHLFSVRSRDIPKKVGEQFGTLYLLHDITIRRQKDRIRGEIIDLLSHELKTPLQSMGMACELIKQSNSPLPKSLTSLVETLQEDLERIKAVANEFFQVTQSHSKVIKLNLNKIPLHHWIPEWLKPFRVLARDKGVKIEFVQEGSAEIFAKIDQAKFPWVISNLVSNAIRYSPKEAVVLIKLTDRGGAVEIQVKDEGPGIAPEDQMRIFEPFYQAKGQSEGNRGLFGVGLTIAKEVLDAHEGRLEYFKNDPHGSVFKIILPFPAIGETN